MNPLPVVMLLLVMAAPLPAAEPVAPLRHAHAHNDYEHPRPLLDALDHGFCSVEADIFLRNGQLLIGHTLFDLKPERTLQKLYLDPLRARVRANGGQVYPKGPAFYLLIDVKTNATATYAVLAGVLEEYAEMLTTTQGGQTTDRAITVIISGNCDRAALAAAGVRHAAIDGRPADLDGKEPVALVPWVSASWGSQFSWKGQGPMPEAEKAKLRAHVAKAHQQGRLVRFWAAPDTPASWQEQRSAGVDLINTDKLAGLRDFLLQPKGTSNP